MAVPNSSVQEVTVTHTFDARRERVFKAWTDPKLVQRWWGPRGFTNPVCEIDARSGGAIRVHMQGPDGTIYPMTGTYKEVVEPERIVFTTTPLDDKGNPLFEVLTTVTFAERAGKTHVSVHNRVLNATAGADMHLQGMEAGWGQSLERLEEIVTEKIT